MLEKNKIYITAIESYSSEGDGIGRINNIAVFIKETLIGETVEIKIIKVGKNCAWGKLINVIHSSKNRVSKKCPYASACGGCRLWHMSYEEELRFKKLRVNDALERIGKTNFKIDVINACKNITRYRNKGIFPVSKEKLKDINIGLFQARSHNVINVDSCLIQSYQAEKVISIFKKWMNKYNISAYDEKNQTGDIRHIFIRTNYESSILICIISTKEKIKHYDKFILDLKTNNINLCGLVLNQNKEKTNVIFGKKFITLYGSYSINEKLCEIKYKLSVPSFFQINRVQAEILYNKALSYANPNPNDIVLDLYCGIGAITLLFARKCRHTIGIEIVKDAIDNAFINAKINNINNVEFICSDATEIACKFAKENYQPDIICVDPPRKGLTQKVIEAILKMSPSKIIYISCNPATFARDINEFDNNSYKLLKAEMVDMFPRTHHIEIVSLLIKQ